MEMEGTKRGKEGEKEGVRGFLGRPTQHCKHTHLQILCSLPPPLPPSFPPFPQVERADGTVLSSGDTYVAGEVLKIGMPVDGKEGGREEGRKGGRKDVAR